MTQSNIPTDHVNIKTAHGNITTDHGEIMNHEQVCAEIEEQKKIDFAWSHLLLFILYFFGLGIVVGIVISIVTIFSGVNIEIILSGYYSLILDAALLMIVLLTFTRVRGFVTEVFSLSPLKERKTYAYIVAGLVFCGLTQYVLFEVLALESAAEQATDLGIANTLSSMEKMWYLLAAVILTPIKEEILYRGILHRFLELRYHFIVGLVVSSGVFGILHFGFPIAATLMGVAFVVIYKLTKSLVPAIILHMLWNLIASIGVIVS